MMKRTPDYDETFQVYREIMLGFGRTVAGTLDDQPDTVQRAVRIAAELRAERFTERDRREDSHDLEQARKTIERQKQAIADLREKHKRTSDQLRHYRSEVRQLREGVGDIRKLRKALEFIRTFPMDDERVIA